MDIDLDLDLDLDLNYLMNCTLEQLNEIDAREKARLEMEQEKCRQAWEQVEMEMRQNKNLQEQLMETLERLVAQSENDTRLTNLMQDSLNEIQNTVARFHEFEEANCRAINESKEMLEKESNKMHELQKQVQNREVVYNRLVRDQQLEIELHEHVRKQFLQKQLELEDELHECELKLYAMRMKAIDDKDDFCLDEDAEIDRAQGNPTNPFHI